MGGNLVRVHIDGNWTELTWEEWESRVRAGRIPGDTLVVFEPVTGEDPKPASELDMYRSLRGDDVVAYQRRLSLGPAPIVTALLVGFQIRVWWLGRIPEVRDSLLSDFVVSAGKVLESGEVWRLFTAGLLQQDLDHLGGNLVMLALTGWYLERTLGRWSLALIFTASVFVGYVASIFGSPFSWSLGSSGGVFGMIAATVVAEFVRPGHLPRRGLSLFGILLVLYMGLMFYGGLVREGVDNMAHFGGLLSGGALALVLQPDLLEVRAGQNRRVSMVVLGGMSALMAFFALAGPRIIPLVPVEQARDQVARAKGKKALTSPPSRTNQSLQWRVPAGWFDDVDVVRSPIFASQDLGAPVHAVPEVGYGVRTNSRERLISVTELADAWTEDVRAEHPSAVLTEPSPTAIGEVAALEVTARLPGEPELVLEWRGAVRGIWTLQETWQVLASREGWLMPLRDRLRASVVWNEPEELGQARIEYDQFPDSPRAAAALALALSRAGEMDAALAMHEDLVSGASVPERRWVGALRSVHVGLELVKDPEDWWDRALAASPTNDVLEEIVGSLRALDRVSEARGLLELAWWERPADRWLARARRGQGMGNRLTPDGIPWRAVFQPDGSRRAAPLRHEGPLTLRAAAQVGAMIDAERARAIEETILGIRGDGTGVVPRLLFLRDGYVRPFDDDLRQALRSEVARSTESRRPRWMPAEVADALAEQSPDGAPYAGRVAEWVDAVR